MPKNFNLNNVTKPGQCDAKRCTKEPHKVFSGGSKFCKKHVALLELDELSEFGSHTDVEEIVQDAQEAGNDAEAIQKFVQPIREEISSLVDQFEQLEIANDNMLETAVCVLEEMHSKYKEVETRRKSVTGPINKSLKTINSWFKPAATALDDAKKVLKRKIQEYSDKKEQERMEALMSGDTEKAMELAAVEPPKGVRKRLTWEFEVDDITKVPIELITVDERLVKLLIKDNDPETLDIPGIKIFQKESLVMGRMS